ncbi:MAG TPA: SpoIIE family protein phosphatase [Solirubrobacteraceae bacterium]|nr:SpoIIE family protein phosphatase [Solirubrobacteraceae bacterium]
MRTIERGALMRAARRHARLCALIALLASCVAGGATATAVSALTVGLPAVEVTVPSTEVSLGGVHVGTPGTTVTVPSVGVTTPSPPASGPELPVTVPVTAPGGERSTGATGTESTPNPTGSGQSTASSGSDGSRDPSKSTSVSPAAGASKRATPAASARSRRSPITRHGGGTRAATAVSATAPTPAATAPTAADHSARATRDAPARRSSRDPLDAIGGRLPLPLPVPDWSKPIILLLLVLALALAVRALVTARRARRLEAQHATLLSDLEAMQAALVPGVPVEIAAEGVSVAYRPADGVAAGGDFYDVFGLAPGRIALVLGDVCGHGREALNRAALTRFTVRAYLQAGLEPRAALSLAGEALCDPSSVWFATVMAAVYDPNEGRLTYASAGHPAPIVLGDGAQAPIEVCCSPPVGPGLPTGRRQSSISLAAASTVCFFTDGLTEARCGDELLGSERLTELLSAMGPDPSASELLRRVTEAASLTPDDMAACILVPRTTAEIGSRVEELEVDREALEGGEMTRFLTACAVDDAEASELVRRAEALLTLRATVILRVEHADGRTIASVTASSAPRAPDLDGFGDYGSATSPPGQPVEAAQDRGGAAARA